MVKIKTTDHECKCKGKKSFTYKKRPMTVLVSRKSIEAKVTLPMCDKCGLGCFSEIKLYKLIREVVDDYRRKNHLLTSEELRRIRENYHMSQKGFAEFIGISTALLSDWELGHQIQEKAYDELVRMKTDSSYMAQILGYQQDVKYGDVSIYTGNKSLNKRVLKNILLHLIEEVKTSKLFLNKILFYIDFKHFKQYGASITGSCYVPLEYGPCPDNYQALFSDLVNEGMIEEGSHYRYNAKKKADLSLLDAKEKLTVQYVIDLARADGGQNLFNLSHMESGFNLTAVGKPIRYDWAESLKI